MSEGIRRDGTRTVTRVAIRAAILLAGAMLVAPACFAQVDWNLGGGRCEHRETRELAAPATETLRVVSGAGPVEIAGEPGLDEFRVSAMLCASRQELLDGLSVSLEDGELRTHYPERSRRGWRNGGSYARIHLKVRAPASAAIEIEDRSGSVSVSDVGRVEVDDGSGSLTLRRTGAVRVRDGSGSIRIEDAGGGVRVNDGSGGLRIEGVAGDVRIEDGSGSFTVNSVTGDVVVERDGSGGIRIEDVGGSVRIGDPGSGGVSVREVEGDLTVERGRRSRIEYADVGGAVELPPERRRGRRRR